MVWGRVTALVFCMWLFSWYSAICWFLFVKVWGQNPETEIWLCKPKSMAALYHPQACCKGAMFIENVWSLPSMTLFSSSQCSWEKHSVYFSLFSCFLFWGWVLACQRNHPQWRGGSIIGSTAAPMPAMVLATSKVVFLILESFYLFQRSPLQFWTMS